MTKSRIAPMRPGIAKFLKRKIGGFVNEYDKALNTPDERAPKGESQPQPAADSEPQPKDAPVKPTSSD